MDQPDLDPGTHVQALCGLERINRWSGSAHILWPSIRRLAGQAGATRLRLLDVATGAGDVPIHLARWARRAGIPLDIDACDRSPIALGHAQRRASEQEVSVRFFEWDAFSGPLPAGYDIITSSLFLHHLDHAQANSLLRRMVEAAGRMVLINDLERSRLGLLFAQVGTRILTSSPVVHADGPMSVAAAFTCKELLGLAEQAGLTGVTVQRRWPFRMLLSWTRKKAGP